MCTGRRASQTECRKPRRVLRPPAVSHLSLQSHFCPALDVPWPWWVSSLLLVVMRFWCAASYSNLGIKLQETFYWFLFKLFTVNNSSLGITYIIYSFANLIRFNLNMDSLTVSPSVSLMVSPSSRLYLLLGRYYMSMVFVNLQKGK